MTLVDQNIDGYFMLRATSADEITGMVQVKMNSEGYVPFGHPTVLEFDGQVVIYQAIVRYHQPEARGGR